MYLGDIESRRGRLSSIFHDAEYRACLHILLLFLWRRQVKKCIGDNACGCAECLEIDRANSPLVDFSSHASYDGTMNRRFPPRRHCTLFVSLLSPHESVGDYVRNVARVPMSLSTSGLGAPRVISVWNS